MDLAPGNLVLAWLNVPDPDHCKIADKWEQSPYTVIEMLNSQLCLEFKKLVMTTMSKLYIIS